MQCLLLWSLVISYFALDAVDREGLVIQDFMVWNPETNDEVVVPMYSSDTVQDLKHALDSLNNTDIVSGLSPGDYVIWNWGLHLSNFDRLYVIEPQTRLEIIPLTRVEHFREWKDSGDYIASRGN